MFSDEVLQQQQPPLKQRRARKRKAVGPPPREKSFEVLSCGAGSSYSTCECVRAVKACKETNSIPVVTAKEEDHQSNVVICTSYDIWESIYDTICDSQQRILYNTLDAPFEQYPMFMYNVTSEQLKCDKWWLRRHKQMRLVLNRFQQIYMSRQFKLCDGVSETDLMAPIEARFHFSVHEISHCTVSSLLSEMDQVAPYAELFQTATERNCAQLFNMLVVENHESRFLKHHGCMVTESIRFQWCDTCRTSTRVERCAECFRLNIRQDLYRKFTPWVYERSYNLAYVTLVFNQDEKIFWGDNWLKLVGFEESFDALVYLQRVRGSCTVLCHLVFQD